ncbi:MAG: pilus assembly protein PilP, partial [Pseudomonadota bacterium]|nr:pilus assembly protein PilP [Pseudomonadota bacterium]
TYALVRTQDNTIYRVKTGNYMGQDFGIVAEISDASVNLKEIVQDGAGDWTERPSSLLLQDEQEQKK